MNNSSLIEPRDATFDLLKFVAIYLVILGHCMGRLGLGVDVLNHPIGKLIVMVNMPLFIFITGYFGKSLYLRSFIQLLVIKYKTLARPCLIYSILCAIICDFVITSQTGSILGGVHLVVNRIITTYWFIWVVLYCSLYSWIAIKIGKKMGLSSILVLLVSFVLLLSMPRTHYIPNLDYMKSMYPFFLLGLLFRDWDLLNTLYKKSLIVFSICIIGYLIGFLLFKGEWSFYYFPTTPLPDVAFHYLFMLIVGILGIVALYIAMKKVITVFPDTRCIKKYAEIGKYTLAIYMLQGIVVEVMDCYPEQLSIINHMLLIVSAIVLSILLLFIISVTIKFLAQNKYMSIWFLGKV